MPMPSATLATSTVAIFSDIPVKPIKPNKMLMAAIMGNETSKPLDPERKMNPTINMTQTMAIKILPI